MEARRRRSRIEPKIIDCSTASRVAALLMTSFSWSPGSIEEHLSIAKKNGSRCFTPISRRLSVISSQGMAPRPCERFQQLILPFVATECVETRFVCMLRFRAATVRAVAWGLRLRCRNMPERLPPQFWGCLLSVRMRVPSLLFDFLEESSREAPCFANRKWDTLSSYIGVFQKQELAFENVIEALRNADNAADRDAKRAMEYEALQIFKQLDDMAEAVHFKDVNKADKSYVGLAVAYDRFLKAADLYDVYDDTDTSKFYDEIPEDLLVYDREEKPKPKDDVLIIYGPDKGRTGKLIGISDASNKGVVRVDYRKKTGTRDASFEVKVVDMENLAKTFPDKPVDAQMKNLMMCPGGLLRRCAGE